MVLPAGLDLSGGIETEQQNEQDEDDWRYAHAFFDHRPKITRARKATRTPINGLETANQKEMSQPGAPEVEFVFTLFSQAFEHQHFTKSEGFFRHEVRRSMRSGLMFKNAGLIGRFGEENAFVRSA